MGYVTKLQVIKRANDARQFYVICPSPLAQALEMEQGEELEWVVEDRHTLTVRRTPQPKRGRKRAGGGR
jgi:antitoxin component of MazEF toxin-antitoxin module